MPLERAEALCGFGGPRFFAAADFKACPAAVKRGFDERENRRQAYAVGRSYRKGLLMKILVGMSGGLDSTYAAYLLKKQGHDVTGAVLRMSGCTAVEEAEESARAVGIGLVTLDCGQRFREQVILPFAREYAAGRTPNPCVMCNRHVKFGVLCDYAEENGFDRVSTGHYADIRTAPDSLRRYIRRAGDLKKDQSYVLWQLTQRQLSMLYFPLAEMSKPLIREEARRLGFRAAESKESQEICFIPDHDYAGYISGLTGKSFAPGDFITPDGRVVGRHRGIIHYTIGQRKGLGLSMGEPVFVTAIDPVGNTVTVAPAGGEYRRDMTVSGLNFQRLAPFSGELRASVRIRYGAQPVPAEVLVDADAGKAQVRFSEPARAVTPGQSAVFYNGDELLFGGFIE